MAVYSGETVEVIAKELTLALIEKGGVQHPIPAEPEILGDIYGKLFKKILQHITEGVHKQKYD